jgi:DNA mismatch repair protein MutL
MNIFVNQRPVKDKQLIGAVRAAYSDTLPKGRYPIIVFFISVALENVDVNVHPAKSEVRFSDPGTIRSLIVGSIQSALRESGIIATAEGAQNTLNRLAVSARGIGSTRTAYPNLSQSNALERENSGYLQSPAAPGFSSPSDMFSGSSPLAKTEEEHTNSQTNDNQKFTENLLGAARAQYHKNYIISETKEGIVIIDQHAAHERLVMERMKADLALNTLKTQLLLLPEIISLTPEQLEKIKHHLEPLNQLGLVIEAFGEDALIVRETPALLGEVNAQELVKDIAEELVHLSNSTSLEDKISHVLAAISCHGSIRSGRILSVAEMNQLLRDMEVTPNSGQCNHGRPTYISLSILDVERLFGRR